MTLREIIASVSEKQAVFNQSDVYKWLSALDGRLKQEVFDTHECEPVSFAPYNSITDPDTALLVPFPYDELYIYYILSKIYHEQQDIVKYNNAYSLYNEILDEWLNKFNRENMPKKRASFKYEV